MSRSVHTPRSYSENLNDQLRAYGASTMGDYFRRCMRLERFVLADKIKTRLAMIRAAEEDRTSPQRIRENKMNHHIFFDEDGNQVRRR